MKFDDLKLAKRILLNRSPFISALLFQLELKIDNSSENPTACTDGTSIRFNESFLNELDLEETVTLLAHETLHCSLCHHLRMSGKDVTNWNIATDYAINLLLVKMGFKPLSDWLYKTEYTNMSAEEIYNLLPETPSEQDKKASEQGQFKEPENLTNEQKTQAKEQAKESLQRAIDIQKKAQNAIANANIPEDQKRMQLDEMGKNLSDFETVIKEFTASQTNWQEILQSFIHTLAYNDYSYSQPNRYNSTEFYQPALYSEEPGNITIALDVSGSTYHIATIIANEVYSALNSLQDDPEMNIIYCSNYIHYDEVINNPEDIKLVYGGGTDFAPVMSAMKDKNTQALIYVTDGYCHSFGECPLQPVIWAIVGNNTRFNPPYGEVIYVNNK